MTTPEPLRAEFDALFDSVREELLLAQTHFDIWSDLFPDADKPELVALLNSYRGFFVPTWQAHLDRFILKVAKVTSGSRNSPSLYRLLGMIERLPPLAPGVDVQACRKRIKANLSIIKRIGAYRDKRAAHTDLEIRRLSPIKLGESKKLLEDLQTLVNEVSNASGKGTFLFRYLERRDTERVLSDLQDYRVKRTARSRKAE